MSDGLDVTFAIGKVKYLCCLHSDSVADGSHGRQTWHRVCLLLVLPSGAVLSSHGLRVTKCESEFWIWRRRCGSRSFSSVGFDRSQHRKWFTGVLKM